MAAVLYGLVSSALRKLGELIQDEVLMTLCVGRDIKRLKQNLKVFWAVRQDAEAMVMRDESRKLWWKRVTDVMFNVEDVIDIFMVHSRMRRESSPCCSMFSCFVKLQDYHSVGTRIKNINTELELIRRETEMFNPGPGSPIGPQPMITTVDRSQTTHLVEPGVVGSAITDDVDSMVKAIIDRCECESIEPMVFGIEGMGGIGKTTLAQKIYCEQRIEKDFQIRMWLCISETYTETGLLKQAIGMAGGDHNQLDNKAELLQRLKDTIKSKSVFLVLDDVCKPDVWRSLLRPAFDKLLNVCVLVTTRSNDVLTAMGATHRHKVNRMIADDGLILLMKNSFQPCDSQFKDLGLAIVEKCDGLPLAIKAVAGILSTRRDVKDWVEIRDTPLWNIEGLPAEIAALYISYINLPYELKQCFLWCALLPPNFEIRRDAVSCWWVAEGFVSKERKRSIHETAERYYYELIRRNLLQPKPEFEDQGESTMHDVLRSLGQYLTEDHSLYMNAKDDLSTVMDVENENPRPDLRRLVITTAVEELPSLEENTCLRTLLVFSHEKLKPVPDSIFRNLQHIRVLIFSGTGIESIPESVGNLVLLKLLDLSDTKIIELPESTGRLISLEHLCLRGCHNLRSLPASLMGLCKITFLELEDALDFVPNGIENFKQLYNLRGVFESGTGFRLDELRRLSNIRRLWVTKLEKATPGGQQVLEKSQFLKELGLRCTMSMIADDRTPYEDDKVQIIQQVYDRLVPSSSLEYIFIVGFPGSTFPEWLRVEPEVIMPFLGHMHLNECISCKEFPPAGQMPQLKVLQIKGADAVENIGTELLGKGVGTPVVFFPKLTRLHIISMCSLKSWSLNTGNPCDNMEGSAPRLSLMPELMRLFLLDCPKLTALPADLSKLAKLKRIHIEGAHGLKEVANLPKVVWLKVKDNRSLSAVSNLCELQDLLAQDCPALDRANNLSSLKRLYMIGCTGAQKFRNCLLGEGVQFRDIQFPDETL